MNWIVAGIAFLSAIIALDPQDNTGIMEAIAIGLIVYGLLKLLVYLINYAISYFKHDKASKDE